MFFFICKLQNIHIAMFIFHQLRCKKKHRSAVIDENCLRQIQDHIFLVTDIEKRSGFLVPSDVNLNAQVSPTIVLIFAVLLNHSPLQMEIESYFLSPPSFSSLSLLRVCACKPSDQFFFFFRLTFSYRLTAFERNHFHSQSSQQT